VEDCVFCTIEFVVILNYIVKEIVYIVIYLYS
jgi:hypothetical protein